MIDAGCCSAGMGTSGSESDFVAYCAWGGFAAPSACPATAWPPCELFPSDESSAPALCSRVHLAAPRLRSQRAKRCAPTNRTYPSGPAPRPCQLAWRPAPSEPCFRQSRPCLFFRCEQCFWCRRDADSQDASSSRREGGRRGQQDSELVCQRGLSVSGWVPRLGRRDSPSASCPPRQGPVQIPALQK